MSSNSTSNNKPAKTGAKPKAAATTTPAPAPVAAPAPAPAPVVEKEKEKKGGKKAAATETPASSASSTVTTSSTAVDTTPATSDATDASAATAETTDAVDVKAMQKNIFAQIDDMSKIISKLRADYRNLERQWDKQKKVMEKSNKVVRKRKPRLNPDGTRELSQFEKPIPVSDEICAFFDKPSGTLMARTEVTKAISAYIKANSLHPAENRKTIYPDAKLKALLHYDADVNGELTYFKLQTFLKPHFPVQEKPEKAQKTKASAVKEGKEVKDGKDGKEKSSAKKQRTA